MRSQEAHRGNASPWRIVAVAIAALLVGAAFGPGVVKAATTAVQKVFITNSSTSPVYTQPPAHSIVNLTGSVFLDNSHAQALNKYFYKVPSGKWLVVENASAWGYGTGTPGPMDFVSLDATGTMQAQLFTMSTPTGSVHIGIPMSQTLDAGVYHLSATAPGPFYVPPNTVLVMNVQREPGSGGVWNVRVWATGYLTSRP